MATQELPSDTTSPLALGVAAIKHSSEKQKEEANPYVDLKMWQMYQSQQLTDMTIECGNYLWKLHKVVFAARSPVFASMIASKFQEGQTSQIKLPVNDPVLIEYMVQFLYMGKYGFASSAGPPRNDNNDKNSNGMSLRDHVKLYEFADKYDIATLVVLVSNRYRIKLFANSRHANDLQELLESIPHIYNLQSLTSSPNRLHEIVVEFMRLKYRDLSNVAAKSAELKAMRTQVMKDVAEFGLEILEHFMDSKVEYPICVACNNHISTLFYNEENVKTTECKFCREATHCIER